MALEHAFTMILKTAEQPRFLEPQVLRYKFDFSFWLQTSTPGGMTAFNSWSWFVIHIESFWRKDAIEFGYPFSVILSLFDLCQNATARDLSIYANDDEDEPPDGRNEDVPRICCC